MSYRVVRGRFHLYYEGSLDQHVGSRPDGDSVWFEPHKSDAFDGLVGPSGEPRRVRTNQAGFAQLRFEAIDALELHYGPRQLSQHPVGARRARDFLLRAIGFDVGQLVYSGERATHVRLAKPATAPGYIVTRSVDPYGRPVSFVFGLDAGLRAQKQLTLTPALARRSLNAKLVAAGEAFPTFYTGLPLELRNLFSALAVRARQHQRAIYRDAPKRAFAAPDLRALTRLSIWPKLFRRLVAYFEEDHSGLIQFQPWLKARPDRDDQLWIVSRGELARLHDIAQVVGQRVRLLCAPEDVVLVPR